MSPDYYWNICHFLISDIAYYRILSNTDASNIVQKQVTKSADIYKSMITLKEYSYLTKRKHKIWNLYLLSKLRKNKGINEIIQKEQCRYMSFEENIIVKAHLIAADSIHHTSSISEILYIIMKPSLAMILHVTKDSSDFENRWDKHCPNGTTVRTCDIKSL